jgi:hypothetical protein
VRFYEINPLVRDWADAYFTFLADARTRRADVDVLMGDARIVMERQLERGNAEKFDVLAIDAFRGDAVPIHLLTKESFAIYSRHVDRDGILAIHVTSAFVDLIPILRRIAEEAGVGCVHIRDGQNVQRGIQYSDWVLMTNNRTFLAHPDVASRSIRMPRPGPLWTDDFSSLFEVLK